jgi:hypothetical protein
MKLSIAVHISIRRQVLAVPTTNKVILKRHPPVWRVGLIGLNDVLCVRNARQPLPRQLSDLEVMLVVLEDDSSSYQVRVDLRAAAAAAARMSCCLEADEEQAWWYCHDNLVVVLS